jgi:tetratricopeptide (TPR) repeat protein
VCSADPLVPDDVIDLLDSLVEKSLVMVDLDDGASRYGLLETIREFAREHLTKRYGMAGTIHDFAQERLVDRDDVAATARRHCEFFLELAKAARAELQGPQQAEWTRCLEVELDNLRAAIALALAGGVDAVIAVKFEVALMQFRRLRGYSTEGRRNVRAALALPGIREEGVARAHALYVGGVLATNQSDYAEASSMLAECLEIRRRLGNPRETAATLSMLVELHMLRDDLETARSHEEEAIGIFRELGHRDGEAIGLLNLGAISVRQGDAVVARELFEQCLAIARSIRHQELESESERNLGELDLASGDVQSARARFTRALQVCKDAEDKRGEAISVWRLGKTETVAGDCESAQRRLAEALPALLAFEMGSEVLDCLEDYASLLRQTGQVDAAVRAYAAAASVRDAQVLPRSTRPDGEKERRMNIDAAREMLGEQAFTSAWSSGQKAGLEDGIARALAAVRSSPVPA